MTVEQRQSWDTLAAQQKGFAASIRQPELAQSPPGVDARCMKIYQELFFNNVKGFLDSGFPVLGEIFGEQRWLQISQDFFANHQSKTPYFLEISQEFLAYLENEFVPKEGDPVYFYELAHYEWLELYVDVAEAENDLQFDANGDFERGRLVLAPVAEGFLYNYPVHQVSAEQPNLEPQATALIVYRNRSYETKFIISNAFTLQLLAKLKEDHYQSVGQLLTELLETHNIFSTQAYQAGLTTLKDWQSSGLVLGVALS